MRDYTIRLDDYGISRERVRELMWICRQYDECQKKAAAVRRGEPIGKPTRRGNTAWHRPDPTGTEAVRLASDRYAARVKAIEDAARAADRVLWRYILRNLCRGIPYSHLGVPCSRPYFTNCRRRFLIELDARV